jgi:hypothetical protein
MVRRKNKKRTKIFAINFQATPDLLNNLSQITLLTKTFSDPLLNQIRDKGYKPISKLRLIPYCNLKKDAPKDVYQLSVKAVYVGKKKAKEAVQNDT